MVKLLHYWTTESPRKIIQPLITTNNYRLVPTKCCPEQDYRAVLVPYAGLNISLLLILPNQHNASLTDLVAVSSCF